MSLPKWESMEIREIGRVVTGKTPPAIHPEYFGTEIPFITPSDMDGQRLIDHPDRWLSPEGASAMARMLIPKGVGVSCIGWQMGKTILINHPSVTNQQINSIIPNEKLVDPLFLYYSLSSRRDDIFRLGAGGSRTPILNKSGFERLQINLPPLEEQSAIASILGALDDKIELNRKMNTTLEAMSRALFKSWFVDFDPVRRNIARKQGDPVTGNAAYAELDALFPAAFEDSPLGKIPQGWRIGILEDLLVLQRGFDLPASERIPGPYPVLAASGPSGSHIETKAKGPGVTTGRSGVLGQVFFVHDDFWPLNTSLWIKEFRISKPHHAYFLLQTLDLLMFNAGSAVPTLNRNHVHSIPMVLPNTEVVGIFETTVADFFRQVKNNEKEILTISSIRDMLLPKLLSGELHCFRER